MNPTDTIQKNTDLYLNDSILLHFRQNLQNKIVYTEGKVALKLTQKNV